MAQCDWTKPDGHNGKWFCLLPPGHGGEHAIGMHYPGDAVLSVLRDLVDALPKCCQCELPATQVFEDYDWTSYRCDAHLPSVTPGFKHGYGPAEYATQLRAALALLGKAT